MSVLKVNPQIVKQERKMKKYALKMMTGYAAQIEFSADFNTAEIGAVQSEYRSKNAAHSFAKVRTGVYMIALKKNVKSKVSRNRWFEIVRDNLQSIINSQFAPATPKKKKVKKPNEKQQVAESLKAAAESGLAGLDTAAKATPVAEPVKETEPVRIIGVRPDARYFFTVVDVSEEPGGVTIAAFTLKDQPFRDNNIIHIPNYGMFSILVIHYRFENGHVAVELRVKP